MTKKKPDYLAEYPNIATMLKDIPINARYIFLPSSESGLAQLEMAILSFRARESVRDEVMSLQKLCGFPLRPNMPVREARAKARLEGKKKDALYRQYRDRSDGDRV